MSYVLSVFRDWRLTVPSIFLIDYLDKVPMKDKIGFQLRFDALKTRRIFPSFFSGFKTGLEPLRICYISNRKNRWAKSVDILYSQAPDQLWSYPSDAKLISKHRRYTI